MSTATCDVCGKPSDPDKLLFSDRGRVCGSCELDLGEEEANQNSQWAVAVGGPLMAFTAGVLTAAGIFPVIGMFTAFAAPFVALIAIGTGVRAFMISGEADGSYRTLLVVCGAVAVLGGMMALGISLVMVMAHLVALTADPYGPQRFQF